MNRDVGALRRKKPERKHGGVDMDLSAALERRHWDYSAWPTCTWASPHGILYTHIGLSAVKLEGGVLDNVY